MNTWYGISEKIKEFFLEKIAKDFYLQLQDTEDEPITKIPYVELQSMPHKNFTPPDTWLINNKEVCKAPYILIQTGNLRIKNDTVTMAVRAVFGVYSSGNYDTEKLVNMPDNKSYIDLMLIMQKAIDTINITQTMGNAQIAQYSEIVADVYDLDAPTYPYSYGYINFDVEYRTSKPELNL